MSSMWSAVAPAWGEHADYVDERTLAATDAMLDAAALGAGVRVLELGCGPGGLGLAAAARVAPGEVTLSDIAPEMVAIAAARAGARGLDNVRTRVLDLASIDVADASYDVVLSRDALMFVDPPSAAANEVRRVLVPGGRAVFAVWGSRARNPWLGVLLDAVTAVTAFPVPPPGVPGPFSLEDAARLRAVLVEARFEAVAVDEVDAPARFTSFDEWWARVPALAGPLGQLLAGMPGDTRQSIRDASWAGLAPYRGEDGGYDIPGVTLVASGVTPRA
jgi:SAM-dependent methyltransferase